MLSRGNFCVEKQRSNELLPFGCRVSGNYYVSPLTVCVVGKRVPAAAAGYLLSQRDSSCSRTDTHTSRGVIYSKLFIEN